SAGLLLMFISDTHSFITSVVFDPSATLNSSSDSNSISKELKFKPTTENETLELQRELLTWLTSSWNFVKRVPSTSAGASFRFRRLKSSLSLTTFLKDWAAR